MQTTIIKTVKGAIMEALFDNCETFSVRHFRALNLQSEADYNAESNYKYEITIRHAEDTDANVLFEEARFFHHIKKAENFVLGQKYLVATYGVVTSWHHCELTEHRPKTETANELYFFTGKRGVYPVLKTELKTRVREANA
jgi:hypothetical protein